MEFCLEPGRFGREQGVPGGFILKGLVLTTAEHPAVWRRPGVQIGGRRFPNMAVVRPQLRRLRLGRYRIGGMYRIAWRTQGRGCFIAHGIDNGAGREDRAGARAHYDFRRPALHVLHRDRGKQLRAIGKGAP